MQLHKNSFRKRAAAFAISGLMLYHAAFGGYSGFESQAAGYDRVSDGVYQMLDGTAITGVVARGIDVSHWKGDIDWQQVARDDVTFAMLGTRYSGQVDPKFRKNAEEASAAGIQLGAYIYSYATDVAMAEAEADFILDLIKDYPISYPVAFDIEDSSQSSLSPQQISDIINAFCSKIEAAGYHPMLYANDYWLANKIDLSQVDYDVWVARYEVKHAFENPVMWQATSSGSVNGVSGGVDINFQYKDFSGDIAPNLWRTINGTAYYYQNHRMQKDTWIDDGTGWFFLNSGGQPSTGWLTQNGISYYLDMASGRMTQGWLQMADGWRYFNGSGAMQTGWVNDGASWYHLNDSGIMSTGWIQDGASRYYLRNSGAMATGWRQIDDAWYYFDGSGAMQTGWVNDGTSWYHLNSSGIMSTGWVEDSSRWYYLNGSGAMMTGWVQDGANRYYMNPADGVMLANTQITVDGVLYDIDASGVCREAAPPESAGQSDGGGQDTAAQPGSETEGTTIVSPVTGTAGNGAPSDISGGSHEPGSGNGSSGGGNSSNTDGSGVSGNSGVNGNSGVGGPGASGGPGVSNGNAAGGTDSPAAGNNDSFSVGQQPG